MVFTHEHTSIETGIGTFAAAKLSDDLTHFISEPFEMFSAYDNDWYAAGITDGCHMYTTEEGELLMTWSNFNSMDSTYCIAVTRSSNGRLDGEWTHTDPLLYAKYLTGVGGGHGMIFTDVDSQMYMSFHSPDNESDLTLMPIIERNGCLVRDQ